MENLKISIVTVCYNAVDSIEATLESVLNQVYDNIEYIVIDGGSTDGTVDIIKKYSDRIAYWISERDNGIFDAMNKGIDIASGNYINFMNSGDIFVSEYTINTVVNYLKSNSYFDVVYGSTQIVRNQKLINLQPSPFFTKYNKFRPMGICHQSIFTRGQLCKIFRFNPKFRLSADYDMIKRIFESGAKFGRLLIPVAKFDLQGISNNNWTDRLKEEAEICGVNISGINFKISTFVYKVKRILLNYQAILSSKHFRMGIKKS